MRVDRQGYASAAPTGTRHLLARPLHLSDCGGIRGYGTQEDRGTHDARFRSHVHIPGSFPRRLVLFYNHRSILYYKEINSSQLIHVNKLWYSWVVVIIQVHDVNLGTRPKMGINHKPIYFQQVIFPSDSKFTYKSARHFLETFSKFFQVRDDFCNLWDAKYAANKSYCEDLTEGKFSWVIVQGIIKGQHILQCDLFCRRENIEVKQLRKPRMDVNLVNAHYMSFFQYFGGNTAFCNIRLSDTS